VKDLPKGWVNAKIKDVSIKCVQNKPNDEDKLVYVDIGSINRKLKVIENPQHLKGIDAPSRARKRINTNDVLVSLTRPNLNAIAHVPKDFDEQYASTGFEVIKSVGVDSRYLFALVKTQNFINAISGVVQGALYPAAKSSDVQNYVFPLAPLNEQIRIADKLDSILAKVDAAQARLDKIPNILKRFRQSVLAAATSGELTKEWRENKDTHKITEKYYAPKEWDLFVFEKLTDVVTSGSRGWAKYYSDQGSTFIRAQNINSDYLNLSDIAFVSLPEKAEGRRTKVENHNLLITITGANVTKAARVKDDILDAYVSQHVALVKLKKNEFSPFIELFIKAENSGRGQLLELAYGAGKPGLNLQNIKGLKIALPSIEEQKEIAFKVERLLSKADAIEKKYHRAKAKINRLTQSILAKAFRGELVSQDQNDEPASELLARIKEETELLKPRKKVKK
jgi:type I restriction enzyme S subunit|tara:strand:- start:8551 stop:9903 length:1353 start_codon:yes stop_codon:yes gene_type:complete